jgi:hypothetical protein
MTDLRVVLEMVNTLSDGDKDALMRYLEKNKQESLISKSKKRILDLHPGAITITDDFNDELPDEFWFGEE